MKKSISLIVLIAGIIVALLAGAGTYAWLQKRAAVQSQTGATQPVVVAAADLSWGKVLDASQVKIVSFLKTSLPPGCFSQPSQVAGRTLLYPVKAGEPLFETQLAPTSVKTGGVSAIISKNKRAMAVKVDKVIGVSGFINPGNHVDVLVTVEGITKTVLENVLVLTVGQQMEMTGNQEKPVPVDVITMEVTSDEAEKLAMAASAGKIMLALRNPTDTDSVTTRGVTVPVLLSSLGAPVAKSSAVHSRPRTITVINTTKPVYVVEGIRGGAVTEHKFNKEEE
jgi:pilus assembly protein CpaB